MGKITKYMSMLGVALACSLCAKSAVVKSGLKINQVPPMLAQTQLTCSGGGCGCSPLGGGLGTGLIAASHLDVEGGSVFTNDQFDNTFCKASHNSTSCDCSHGFNSACGCGFKTKTVCLDGDICYTDYITAVESGSAHQEAFGHDLVSSNTETIVGALGGTPQVCACLVVKACPPELGE